MIVCIQIDFLKYNCIFIKIYSKNEKRRGCEDRPSCQVVHGEEQIKDNVH